MHKPCAEAQPGRGNYSSATNLQGCTGVPCSCRSCTTCISHSFLLLFHAWCCRAPERASAWYQHLLEALPAHPGLQQKSEAVALEKQGRHMYSDIILSPCIETHTGTSQAHASLALAAYLPWVISICLLECSLGEEKGMGLERGFPAREYNPQPAPLRASFIIAGAINEMFLAVTL